MQSDCRAENRSNRCRSIQAFLTTLQADTRLLSSDFHSGHRTLDFFHQTFTVVIVKIARHTDSFLIFPAHPKWLALVRPHSSLSGHGSTLESIGADATRCVWRPHELALGPNSRQSGGREGVHDSQQSRQAAQEGCRLQQHPSKIHERSLRAAKLSHSSTC